MATDRPDVQYPAKEVCRDMAAPKTSSGAALKRLGRYLVGLPRLVWTYPWQTVWQADAYSDTDWAGCPKTRKSTMGGCVMLGAHTIKTWSSTLQNICLSSGEAEFYGLVKAASQGLGMQALLHDLGCDIPLNLYTDSSAAIGTCSRQGLGKQRHLDTTSLWIQQKLLQKAFRLKKVSGEENPADLFTKHFTDRRKIHDCVRWLGCEFRAGRAASAPAVKKG